MQKLRSVQVLRGVAALGVVVHHFCDSDSSAVYGVGAGGVDLFFVVSGFIMAMIGQKQSAVGFMRERVWRIYPLWLISSVPLAYVFGTDFYQLLTTFTLWPIWGVYYVPLNDVGWSLSYEMLFYCVFAIGLATRRSVPFALFAILIPLGTIFTQVPLLRFLGNPMAIEFLAGVVIARLPLSERLGAISLTGGLLMLVLAPHVDPGIVTRPAVFLRVYAWGAPAALIVYGATSLERHFARRVFSLPVFLGDASYSIYLFHRRPLDAGISSVFGAAFGVAIGLFVHCFLERPLQRLRKRQGSLWLDHEDEVVVAEHGAGRVGKVCGDRAS